jgi:hypothetical protein
MKTEAQHELNELFKERLIPFQLTAHIVQCKGHGIYTVEFFDSRFKTLSFLWKEGESFKNIFRAALLKKVRNPVACFLN